MDPRYARIEEQHRRLQERLADHSLSLTPEYQRATREYKKLDPLHQKLQEYKKIISDTEGLKHLHAHDPEMRELADEELKALVERRLKLEGEFEEFLTPKDPRNDKDVIVEIRAGAGGDEAALFAGELFRLYNRYAAENNFNVEVFDSSPTGLGGFKEVVFNIKGLGAWRHFKYESGVHRVQRVPDTEASGRVHTSTATVAVMPEADEVDIQINPVDLRIDVYRASGAGGQHVNRTESAVRITHLPTGVAVACQDERSQLKNKARAMSLLRSRLYQAERERVDMERRDLRRSQVGTGDRSEKIRTYNFPQDRVTDHRLNRNFHNLPAIMEGDIGDIIHAHWQAEKAQKTELPLSS